MTTLPKCEAVCIYRKDSGVSLNANVLSITGFSRLLSMALFISSNIRREPTSRPCIRTAFIKTLLGSTLAGPPQDPDHRHVTGDAHGFQPFRECSRPSDFNHMVNADFIRKAQDFLV